MTLLLVEQNANLVLKFADDAYVLEAGRIVLSGEADEIAGGRGHPPLVPGVLRRPPWNASSR